MDHVLEICFVDTIGYEIITIAIEQCLTMCTLTISSEIGNFVVLQSIVCMACIARVLYVCMCLRACVSGTSNLYSRGLYGTIPDQLFDLVNNTSIGARL